MSGNTALTLHASGYMIFVDTRCRDIAPHLLMTGSWEPHYAAAFHRLLRPGMTVFDIGANHGVYTLVAASVLGPQGRIHAFEPNPRYGRLLDQTVAVNGLAAVATVHKVAVSDGAGEAELLFSFTHAGGGVLRPEEGPERRAENAHRVRTVALDALFPDPEFRLDAVKLDVEGHEGRALLGMRRLLERSPEVRILFEFAPALMQLAGRDAAATIGMLEDLGFRFWAIRPNAKLAPVAAAELKARTEGLENLIAARRPPEG